MTSLFTTLVSYIPNTARNPQEDYLTKLFAWLLTHIDRLDVQFCQFLLDRVEDPKFIVENSDRVLVDTQVAIGDGFIDMVLETNGNGFICEHKIDSPLGYRQIERYAQAYQSRTGTFYTVLITAKRSLHTQDADIKLVWADVEEFLRGLEGDYQHEQAFLIRQFLQFLHEKGLGRAIQVIRTAADDLRMQFIPICTKLPMLDWTAVCPQLPSLNPDHFKPEFQDRPLPKEGRIGVSFFDLWIPGLFAGIVYDNQDHKLDAYDRTKTPYLIVTLEFTVRTRIIKGEDRKWRTLINKQWELYRAHHNLAQLRIRLMESSDGFLFDRSPKNRCRVIPLYTPLLPIIAGARSESEQIERIFMYCCRGINLLTQDGLLAEIKEEMTRSHPELQV